MEKAVSKALTLTLNNVIRKYGINPRNALLKLNCEGCGYGVILVGCV